MESFGGSQGEHWDPRKCQGEGVCQKVGIFRESQGGQGEESQGRNAKGSFSRGVAKGVERQNARE